MASEFSEYFKPIGQLVKKGGISDQILEGNL